MFDPNYRADSKGRATVIVDASFCHATQAAGWAAWVTLNIEGQEVRRIRKAGNFPKGIYSSGDAEFEAALIGAQIAIKEGATKILIQTDCLAVVDGINYKRPRDKATSWPMYAERWSQFRRAFPAHLTFEGRHVKGHTQVDDTRSWVNRWCDREAKAFMRLQRTQRGNAR